MVGLVPTHPGCRQSSTGMVPSTLRKLGELLDKTINVVPAKHKNKAFVKNVFVNSLLSVKSCILPPCDKIVGLASSQDNRVFVRDPTSVLPTVLQCKS